VFPRTQHVGRSKFSRIYITGSSMNRGETFPFRPKQRTSNGKYGHLTDEEQPPGLYTYPTPTAMVSVFRVTGGKFVVLCRLTL
jgi:hypothetical protein